jgi:hypothetical protein
MDRESPSDGSFVLVQLTANWPARVWRTALNTCLLNVVVQGLRRQENELSLGDIVRTRQILTWKLFVSMIISDVLLVSPMAIAQVLLGTDLFWAMVYAVIGFLLNWAFGLAQILVFEDPSLSIGACFVWSAAIAFDAGTFSVVLVSSLVVVFATPLIVTAPFLLVLQMLTFFEVFGYRSPAEVCY